MVYITSHSLKIYLRSTFNGNLVEMNSGINMHLYCITDTKRYSLVFLLQIQSIVTLHLKLSLEFSLSENYGGVYLFSNFRLKMCSLSITLVSFRTSFFEFSEILFSVFQTVHMNVSKHHIGITSYELIYFSRRSLTNNFIACLHTKRLSIHINHFHKHTMESIVCLIWRQSFYLRELSI